MKIALLGGCALALSSLQHAGQLQLIDKGKKHINLREPKYGYICKHRQQCVFARVSRFYTHHSFEKLDFALRCEGLSGCHSLQQNSIKSNLAESVCAEDRSRVT